MIPFPYYPQSSSWRFSMRNMLLVSAFLFVGGCTNSAKPGDGGGGGEDMGGETGDLALPPGQMTMRLISSTFTLAPGTETYQCERLTIPDDMYIVRITPVSPVGVHHEVMAIDTTGSPDGTQSCSAA